MHRRHNEKFTALLIVGFVLVTALMLRFHDKHPEITAGMTTLWDLLCHSFCIYWFWIAYRVATDMLKPVALLLVCQATTMFLVELAWDLEWVHGVIPANGAWRAMYFVPWTLSLLCWIFAWGNLLWIRFEQEPFYFWSIVAFVFIAATGLFLLFFGFYGHVINVSEGKENRIFALFAGLECIGLVLAASASLVGRERYPWRLAIGYAFLVCTDFIIAGDEILNSYQKNSGEDWFWGLSCTILAIGAQRLPFRFSKEVEGLASSNPQHARYSAFLLGVFSVGVLTSALIAKSDFMNPLVPEEVTESVRKLQNIDDPLTPYDEKRADPTKRKENMQLKNEIRSLAEPVRAYLLEQLLPMPVLCFVLFSASLASLKVGESLKLALERRMPPTWNSDERNERESILVLHEIDGPISEMHQWLDEHAIRIGTHHLYKRGYFDQPSDDSKVFVAMPFQENWSNQMYEEISKACEAKGLNAVRSDSAGQPADILQVIWKELSSASAVIAVLTSGNLNVMYEVGMAHALGKPVTIIVSTGTRNKFFKEDEFSIPFDVAHIMRHEYNRLNRTEAVENAVNGLADALLETRSEAT